MLRPTSPNQATATAPAEPAEVYARLRVTDVTAGYGPVPVVRGMSLIADPGRIVGVIGPNGSGKSTFIKSIMGIVRPTTGRIELGDTPLGGRRCDEIVRAGIGYLPQSNEIFGNLTVAENLEMGGITNRDARPGRRQYVLQLFPLLEARLRQRARTLSGGEAKMLGLGRVLMSGPSVVLMDEPSAGLAPAAVKVLLGYLEMLRNEGLTLVVVEQNVRAILSLADWAYVMADGTNLFEGPAEALGEDIPLLGRVFMGHDRDAARQRYSYSYDRSDLPIRR